MGALDGVDPPSVGDHGSRITLLGPPRTWHPYLLLQVPDVAQVEPGTFSQREDEEGSEQEELVVARQQAVL